MLVLDERLQLLSFDAGTYIEQLNHHEDEVETFTNPVAFIVRFFKRLARQIFEHMRCVFLLLKTIAVLVLVLFKRVCRLLSFNAWTGLKQLAHQDFKKALFRSFVKELVHDTREADARIYLLDVIGFHLRLARKLLVPVSCVCFLLNADTALALLSFLQRATPNRRRSKTGHQKSEDGSAEVIHVIS